MSNNTYKKQIHHITPKCMLNHKSKEFVNHPSNLVELEYKYHIAVHKWLFMLTGHKGCESAYHSMKTGKFYYDNTNNTYRLGKYHTKKSKSKMSNAMKGKYDGINNPFYGKTHTDKIKRNLSHIHKGKRISNNQKNNHSKRMTGKNNPMYGMTGKSSPSSKQCYINGHVFYSLIEAGKYLNVSSETIRRWCKTHIPHCYVV